MKLLDAGEVLPSDMILSLVAKTLASRECQKRGWVLEGVGAAGGVDELEEAIVMAAEVRLFGPWLRQLTTPGSAEKNNILHVERNQTPADMFLAGKRRFFCRGPQSAWSVRTRVLSFPWF